MAFGKTGGEVGEDFCCGLAAADDGYTERSGRADGVGLEECLVFGGVDYARMMLGEAVWDLGAAADGDEDVLGANGSYNSGHRVAARHRECLDRFSGDGGFWHDRLDFLAVGDYGLKVTGTPAHVVFVFQATREEGADVTKLDQPVVLVKIVDECEMAPWITEGSEVLEERYLHLCARYLHTGMPGEL